MSKCMEYKDLENRNELGDTILEFALAFDLVVTNTYFKKREDYLITYKSGTNRSKIDYFLLKK